MKNLKTYTKFLESNYSDDELSKFLRSSLIVNQNQIDQFREDKAFIKDTFLELEDKEFMISFGISMLSSLKIKNPTPYFVISYRDNFKFSDVKDEILQIKSYLDERWLKCGVVFENYPDRTEVNIDEEDYDQLDDHFQSGIINLAVFFNI